MDNFALTPIRFEMQLPPDVSPMDVPREPPPMPGHEPVREPPRPDSPSPVPEQEPPPGDSA